jgi:tyrosine-protein kinase Etk/Wzc
MKNPFKRGGKRPESEGAPPLRVANLAGEQILDLPSGLVAIYRRWYTYLSREEPLPHRLGLASAVREEGVTSIALGLASVMASDLEQRIAVIESNWWWPGLAAAAHIAEEPGLAELVTGKTTLEEACRGTSLPNLFLIPAGSMSECDRSRAARGAALVDTLQRIDEAFDQIILDIPAVLAVKDSPILAAKAGGICMVIRQGITPISIVQKALDEIEHLPVRGSILNGMNAKLSKVPFLNLGSV